MALRVRQSTRFRRDVKRLLRQRFDLSRLELIVKLLVAQEALDERHRDHPLVGNWRGYWECHIQADWLLIYRVEANELQLVRTGSHSELFGQ
jgi:mRNA interferase YafQ